MHFLLNLVFTTGTMTDFWTTRCVRCPAALDKLDALAANDRYANVQFLSVCCDKADGAREIIDKSAEPKWQNVHHYFMEQQDKETCKKMFGFASVPFYVVVNAAGIIVQAGSKVDFESVPGMLPDQENVVLTTASTTSTSKQVEQPVSLKEKPAFILDDLDF